MRAIDVVRRVAPGARPEYLATVEAGDAKLAAAAINTPLRLAHPLAQFLHETEGMTITRESGNYRADRIVEIFGVGTSSAAVTRAEAVGLAGNGPALFERVYGLGNPKMAHDLGNTQKGDGWLFRGNSLNQGTGRGFHARASKMTGVDFVGAPELATTAEHALTFALCEWDATFLALSDRNDIRGITKRLNGGYNGYADRVEWFDKVWKLIGSDEAWLVAANDNGTADLQIKLNALGYGLKADGRYGPKTEAAVRDFQAKAGVKVDGIAGAVTRAVLDARLATAKMPKAA